MMGPTHRVWGAWQGMATGAAVGFAWGPVASLATSAVWAGLGYALATLPDRAEGPLGAKHRGGTHWPEPPLLLGGGALYAGIIGVIPIFVGIIIAGISCAILSHWTGDFMFGKAHVAKSDDGHITAIIRPRGVPMLFGTYYAGLGMKVNGKLEKWFRWVLTGLFPFATVLVIFIVLRYGV